MKFDDLFNKAWWKENWPIAAAVALALVGILFLTKKNRGSQATGVGLQPSPQAIQAQADIEKAKINASGSYNLEALRQGTQLQVAGINANRDIQLASLRNEAAISGDTARLEASSAANGGANYRATLGFLGSSVMPLVTRSLLPTQQGAYGVNGMGSGAAWERFGSGMGTTLNKDLYIGDTPSGLPLPPLPSGFGGSGTVPADSASTPADWAGVPNLPPDFSDMGYVAV